MDNLKALARTLKPRSNVCLTAFMGNLASDTAKRDFKTKCDAKNCQYKADTNECLKYVYASDSRQNPGQVQAHGADLDNRISEAMRAGAVAGTVPGYIAGAPLAGILTGAVAGGGLAAGAMLKNKLENKFGRSLVEVKKERKQAEKQAEQAQDRQAQLLANAQVRATTPGFINP
jgi:hypothetical protein